MIHGIKTFIVHGGHAHGPHPDRYTLGELAQRLADAESLLRRETAARKAAQRTLSSLQGHCVRIEAENQRYRGATLDAKRAQADSINLSAAEAQSGMDRVKWAQGLIEQLPRDHEGRNSWLINYGRGEGADLLRTAWADRNGRPCRHADDNQEPSITVRVISGIDELAEFMSGALANKSASGSEFAAAATSAGNVAAANDEPGDKPSRRDTERSRSLASLTQVRDLLRCAIAGTAPYNCFSTALSELEIAMALLFGKGAADSVSVVQSGILAEDAA